MLENFILFLATLIVLYALYLLYKVNKERKLIEKAFYARGYVFVELCTISGETHKGFTSRAQLKLIRERATSFNMTLESYKIGEKKIIPSTAIEWIKQLRPPE